MLQYKAASISIFILLLNVCLSSIKKKSTQLLLKITSNNILPNIWWSRCGHIKAFVAHYATVHILKDIFQSCSASIASAAPLENTRHLTNVALMMGQRRRRWPIIKTTLNQSLVFEALSAMAVTINCYQLLSNRETGQDWSTTRCHSCRQVDRPPDRCGHFKVTGQFITPNRGQSFQRSPERRGPWEKLKHW